MLTKIKKPIKVHGDDSKENLGLFHVITGFREYLDELISDIEAIRQLFHKLYGEYSLDTYDRVNEYYGDEVSPLSERYGKLKEFEHQSRTSLRRLIY